MSTDRTCNRLPTGHSYKDGSLGTKVGQNLPPVPEPNDNSCRQTLGIFQCCDCGVLFKEKHQLFEHVKATHVPKRFVCPQCPRMYSSKSGLNEHVKRIHQQQVRYRCETCGKGFSVRSNYYDHLAAHTGARRNVCPICLTQFTFKCSLKSHVLHFHPNEIDRVQLTS